MVDDLISRRDAIEAFMTATSDGDKAEWCKWVLEQLPSAQSVDKDINVPCKDTISRQAMQEMVDRIGGMYPYRQIGNRDSYSQYNEAWTDAINRVDAELNSLPSTQSERDIPIKPIETTDKAWGIPSRQAVCPKCGYYLGHIAFLDSYKGKRVTYCETCGQAIDWEGWVFDE